jgi:hypothetical protein
MQRVLEFQTGSYDSIFIDYMIKGGPSSGVYTGARAGIILASWLDKDLSYSELTSGDAGDSSAVNLVLSLNSSGSIFLDAEISTGVWEIKTITKVV